MRVAQERQSRYASKGRKESVYEIGDLVLLNAKNLRLQRANAHRLQHRLIGPFKILKKAWDSRRGGRPPKLSKQGDAEVREPILQETLLRGR